MIPPQQDDQQRHAVAAAVASFGPPLANASPRMGPPTVLSPGAGFPTPSVIPVVVPGAPTLATAAATPARLRLSQTLAPTPHLVTPHVVRPAANPAASVVATRPLAGPGGDAQQLAVQSMTDSEAASLGAMMSAGGSGGDKAQKPHLRKAAGSVWSDPSIDEWDPSDHRLFCGDLGNEVTDEVLAAAFRKYPSFLKAKVVRDRKTGKTKGYGFVSFHKPEDMLGAMKEMNRKYVGNRPIRVLRSRWKEREVDSEKQQKTDKLDIQKHNSKTLKKFKKLGMPVTGGRKLLEARQSQQPIKRSRGYYGPGGSGRMAHYHLQNVYQPRKNPGMQLVTNTDAHLLDNI